MGKKGKQTSFSRKGNRGLTALSFSLTGRVVQRKQAEVCQRPRRTLAERKWPEKEGDTNFDEWWEQPPGKRKSRVAVSGGSPNQENPATGTEKIWS